MADIHRYVNQIHTLTRGAIELEPFRCEGESYYISKYLRHVKGDPYPKLCVQRVMGVEDFLSLPFVAVVVTTSTPFCNGRLVLVVYISTYPLG